MTTPTASRRARSLRNGAARSIALAAAVVLDVLPDPWPALLVAALAVNLLRVLYVADPKRFRRTARAIWPALRRAGRAAGRAIALTAIGTRPGSRVFAAACTARWSVGR